MNDLETVDVLCFVFPDGQTHFMQIDRFNQHDPHDVMALWKAGLDDDRRRRYEEAQVMGGFVWMHMLRSDFEKLSKNQKTEDKQCTTPN